MEDKAVFVRLTISDDDVGELFYNLNGRGIHQIYGATIIRLSKILAFRKSGENVSRLSQR